MVSDKYALKMCRLVSLAWLRICDPLLFYNITIRLNRDLDPNILLCPRPGSRRKPLPNIPSYVRRLTVEGIQHHPCILRAIVNLNRKESVLALIISSMKCLQDLILRYNILFRDCRIIAVALWAQLPRILNLRMDRLVDSDYVKYQLYKSSITTQLQSIRASEFAENHGNMYDKALAFPTLRLVQVDGEPRILRWLSRSSNLSALEILRWPVGAGEIFVSLEHIYALGASLEHLTLDVRSCGTCPVTSCLVKKQHMGAI